MIRNAEYVIAAYSIVSVALVIYTAFIHINLHKIKKKLKQISDNNPNE